MQLDSIAHVCLSLENAIQPTFGPLGSDVLIRSPGNPTLITNSGTAIFEQLSMQHPIGELMVKSATEHKASFGDGAVTFLVHVAWTLEACRRFLAGKGVRELIRLLEGFRYLQDQILQTYYKSVFPKSMKKIDLECEKALNQFVWNLVSTAFSGHLSQDAAFSLSTQTTSWILASKGQGQSLESCCRILLECECWCEVEGESVQETSIVGGVVLPKPLMLTSMPRKITPAHFVVTDMLGVMPQSGERTVASKAEFSVHASYQGVSALESAIMAGVSVASKLCRILQSRNVNLVVVTNRVDERTGAIFSRHGIQVVQLVEQVDAKRLCTLAGISMGSLGGHASPTAASQIDVGVAGFSRQGRLGARAPPVVHIGAIEAPLSGRNGSHEANHGPAHTLIICAPSKGFARQYTRLVTDAVRCVRSATHYEDKSVGVVVPGGCAMEIALYSYLACEVATVKDPWIRAAYSSFQEGVGRVVENFIQACTARKTDKAHTLWSVATTELQDGNDGCFVPDAAGVVGAVVQRVVHETNNKHFGGFVALTKDIKRRQQRHPHRRLTLAGRVPLLRLGQPGRWGIWHPASAARSLPVDVIHVILQILRIDGILPVVSQKQNLSLQTEIDESEDSSDNCSSCSSTS
eukprot:Rmarinus@m.20317